jgi:dTMP kinase
MRGRFIVFEGLDRSGKSTQVENLAKKLEENGRRAVVKKFPGRREAWRPALTPDRTTAIGKMIDAYLQNANELDDHAIHLLFSANRWEAA